MGLIHNNWPGEAKGLGRVNKGVASKKLRTQGTKRPPEGGNASIQNARIHKGSVRRMYVEYTNAVTRG